MVADFNNCYTNENEQFLCTKLHCSFDLEVVCAEEFANTGLFCKTIDRAGNRKSCANIGRNFKSCNLTDKQFVSKEINCSSLEPVGIEMTSNEGGASSLDEWTLLQASAGWWSKQQCTTRVKTSQRYTKLNRPGFS